MTAVDRDIPGAAAVQAPPVRAESNATAAPAQAAHILVVDDHDGNRKSLTRLLERSGYRVTAVADGESAMAFVQETVPDLIVLDVIMPGLSGWDVLKRIRATHGPSDLAIIMATARDDSEDVVNALSLGANDYVTKPLDYPVVLARIETQLALSASMRRIKALEEGLRARNAELEEANRELAAAAERTRAELELAARVQSGFLPANPPAIPGFNFAWAYEPCDQLAGDALNYFPLCDGYVGMFVLDVSGHGVGASLLSVAAMRALSPMHSSLLLEGEGRPASATSVVEQMNQMFPFDAPAWQFITLFYALLDTRSRELTYVSAGHPAALHLARDGTARPLETGGAALGFGTEYRERTVRLGRGDRVFIYSDGLTEAMNDHEVQFGVERTTQVLQAAADETLQASLEKLIAAVNEWRNGAASRDDLSALAFEVA